MRLAEILHVLRIILVKNLSVLGTPDFSSVYEFEKDSQSSLVQAGVTVDYHLR